MSFFVSNRKMVGFHALAAIGIQALADNVQFPEVSVTLARKTSGFCRRTPSELLQANDENEGDSGAANARSGWSLLRRKKSGGMIAKRAFNYQGFDLSNPARYGRETEGQVILEGKSKDDTPQTMLEEGEFAQIKKRTPAWDAVYEGKGFTTREQLLKQTRTLSQSRNKGFIPPGRLPREYGSHPYGSWELHAPFGMRRKQWFGSLNDELKERDDNDVLWEMGRCDQGFDWNKVGGGFRCKGGGHFVSDKEFKEFETAKSSKEQQFPKLRLDAPWEPSLYNRLKLSKAIAEWDKKGRLTISDDKANRLFKTNSAGVVTFVAEERLYKYDPSAIYRGSSDYLNMIDAKTPRTKIQKGDRLVNVTKAGFVGLPDGVLQGPAMPPSWSVFQGKKIDLSNSLDEVLLLQVARNPEEDEKVTVVATCAGNENQGTLKIGGDLESLPGNEQTIVWEANWHEDYNAETDKKHIRLRDVYYYKFDEENLTFSLKFNTSTTFSAEHTTLHEAKFQLFSLQDLDNLTVSLDKTWNRNLKGSTGSEDFARQTAEMGIESYVLEKFHGSAKYWTETMFDSLPEAALGGETLGREDFDFIMRDFGVPTWRGEDLKEAVFTGKERVRVAELKEILGRSGKLAEVMKDEAEDKDRDQSPEQRTWMWPITERLVYFSKGGRSTSIYGNLRRAAATQLVQPHAGESCACGHHDHTN